VKQNEHPLAHVPLIAKFIKNPFSM
jgi:hypothetical protein